MKVIITRKRFNDVHTYTRVKNAVIKKKGRLFPSLDIDVEFGEGATSHYTSDKHNQFWEIDHTSNPGAGSMGCSRIEIYEENHSSVQTAKREVN